MGTEKNMLIDAIMDKTIRIYCKNTNCHYDVERGKTLLELYHDIKFELPFPVVAAQVNHKLEDLNFFVYRPKNIEFLDASSDAGMRVYVRTLIMVLSCAVEELYNNADVHIEHPVSKGYYCTMIFPKWHARYGTAMTAEMVDEIKQRMQQIIAEDRRIDSVEEPMEKVVDLFSKRPFDNTALFETIGAPYCRYVRMGNYVDFETEVVMPSTGYVKIFDVELYHDGLILRIPNRYEPTCLEENVTQEKMFDIFNEYLHWNDLMHISTVCDFNRVIKNQDIYNTIQLAEALHEKKVAQIADQITHREGGRPSIVLISGPSSSGKTTFSKRLTIQLMVNGLDPVVLSMDNYFVNREDTPKDENGDWDFEHLEALDLPFFNQQLADLLAGKEINLPTFDFKDGRRMFNGDTLQLKEKSIIIIEGIHALDPHLLANIPSGEKFKIYVSALTTINIDNHNWISTTDTRLLRRIVRDYRYRHCSARETLARTPSVRRGEERWIYPYQDEADVMFNSALLFELAVLKQYADPILQEVPKNCPEYAEAYRLVQFLSYFETIPEDKIPPTSLLREFVGGSSFRY